LASLLINASLVVLFAAKCKSSRFDIISDTGLMAVLFLTCAGGPTNTIYIFGYQVNPPTQGMQHFLPRAIDNAETAHHVLYMIGGSVFSVYSRYEVIQFLHLRFVIRLIYLQSHRPYLTKDLLMHLVFSISNPLRVLNPLNKKTGIK
jgi:hypothetical protein